MDVGQANSKEEVLLKTNGAFPCWAGRQLNSLPPPLILRNVKWEGWVIFLDPVEGYSPVGTSLNPFPKLAGQI